MLHDIAYTSPETPPGGSGRTKSPAQQRALRRRVFQRYAGGFVRLEDLDESRMDDPAHAQLVAELLGVQRDPDLKLASASIQRIHYRDLASELKDAFKTVMHGHGHLYRRGHHLLAAEQTVVA